MHRRLAALALAAATVGIGAAPAAADTPVAATGEAIATPTLRSRSVPGPGISPTSLFLGSSMVLVGGVGGVVLFRRPTPVRV